MGRSQAGWLAVAGALLMPGHAAAQAYANPGAVIAAEIAFARLAGDSGQWAAHVAAAAPGAVLLAPAPVAVAEYVKKRAEPASPDRWSPHAVWSSCDGGFAVTAGGWENGARHGRFLTLWQRQEKGEYRWLLRQTRETVEPVPEPEMIAAAVAQCPPRMAEPAPPPPVPAKGRAKQPPPPPVNPLGDASADGTLRWRAEADAQGGATFLFSLRREGAMQDIAPAGADGAY